MTIFPLTVLEIPVMLSSCLLVSSCKASFTLLMIDLSRTISSLSGLLRVTIMRDGCPAAVGRIGALAEEWFAFGDIRVGL